MEKLNQWLSLITNIGVLIGLAFLVLELEQNRSELRMYARQSLTQENAGFTQMLIENPKAKAVFNQLVSAGPIFSKNELGAYPYYQ